MAGRSSCTSVDRKPKREGAGSTSKVFCHTDSGETARPWKDVELVGKTLARGQEA